MISINMSSKRSRLASRSSSRRSTSSLRSTSLSNVPIASSSSSHRSSSVSEQIQIFLNTEVSKFEMEIRALKTDAEDIDEILRPPELIRYKTGVIIHGHGFFGKGGGGGKS